MPIPENVGTISSLVDIQMLLSENFEDATKQVTHACMKYESADNIQTPTIQKCILQLINDTAAKESMTEIPWIPIKNPILHLTDAVKRTLWHMRLGHIHHERIAKTRKATKGIQEFSLPLDLEKCGECLKAKLRKIARGKSEEADPT